MQIHQFSFQIIEFRAVDQFNVELISWPSWRIKWTKSSVTPSFLCWSTQFDYTQHQ